MSLRKQRLEEFESFYEMKIEQWHKAMMTGDTSSLEADMVEDYKVFFFKKEAEAPDILQLKRHCRDERLRFCPAGGTKEI